MILLFGAQGQLGQALLAAAAAEEIDVTGPAEEAVDITDAKAVGETMAHLRPDLVINAAAYTDVDRAESDVEMAWRVNAVGPQLIAEGAARAGVPVIHISTDYVFDGTKTGAYREDDPVAPISVYGKSKAAGEAAVRRATRRHLILRTAWLHGPYGRNFAKTVIRLATDRDELRIVADQFGSPTSAADLALAILRVAPRLLTAEDRFGTFHLAGDGATSWFGFAESIVDELAKITGHRPNVTPIATAEYPTAARRPQNSVLDSTGFAEAFGIRLGRWQGSVGTTVTAILTAEAVA